MHLGLGDFQAVYFINFGLYYNYNPKIFCNPGVVIYVYIYVDSNINKKKEKEKKSR